MRGLFAKIFLSFFLTVVLLGALLEVTALRNDRRRVLEMFRPLAEQSARRVADAYERGGEGALGTALAQLPFAAALVDERGQTVGPVNKAMASAAISAGETIASAGEPLTSFAVLRNLAFAPVTLSDGRHLVLVFILPHERWSAILNTLDQYPALRLSILALVAGIICFVLARHITTPLIHLRATAARMADGHLDARAGSALSARHDEIGALGRDFDQMADRLAALVATERRLLADVSHELRSPLARLTVAVGLLRQRGDAHQEDELARVEREVARLDQLIGQSLTLARLDGSAGTDRREAFDLANLVQEVVADGDFEARAIGRHVQLIAADACTMHGIVELVRSAIENVVRNAIRYTPDGTTVDVQLRNDRGPGGDVARIRVRDHGPGIPEALLPVVFQPFRKVEDGRRSGGAGLGLAIADRVARLHGGSIRASNAAGGGLIVEIELPLQFS